MNRAVDLLHTIAMEQIDTKGDQTAHAMLLPDDFQYPGTDYATTLPQALANREIGERLFLALDTVKGHNRRIFAKLQVQRRTEAVARARALGLV